MSKSGYYIYDETEVKGPFKGNLGNIDPNRQYVRHYANYVELNFILRAESARGHVLNTAQVKKELGLCESKLEWWSKRPGFALSECLAEILVIKRNWKVRDIPDRWSKGA